MKNTRNDPPKGFTVTTNAHSFIVRPLTPEDYDAFFQMRVESLEQSPRSYGNHVRAWRTASTEQVNALLVASESGESGVVLGAWNSAKELVGLLGVQHERKPNVQHKATLWGFFVRAAHRRQGAGGALLDAAIEHGERIERFRHLRALVTVCDQDALRLFASRGFTEYGREPKGLMYEGDFFDQVFLFRPFVRESL